MSKIENFIRKILCNYFNVHHGEVTHTHYGDDGFYEFRKCWNCGLEWEDNLDTGERTILD